MSPVSPQVVVAAFVMSSPVFYQALVAGTAPLDFALTRFLIIWVVTWVVVSLVVDLLFPSRLETERRVRDLMLAEREVAKALAEADAEAAAEAAAEAERTSGASGLAALDAADAESADDPTGSSGAAVPVQRQQLADGAVADRPAAS